MLPSLQVLLSAIIDYAGLFPPAQLSLPEAMTTFDRAQSSPTAWMLDRFVLPAARLSEWITLLPNLRKTAHPSPQFLSQSASLSQSQFSSQPSIPEQWPLSLILSSAWETELNQIHQITTGQSPEFHITIRSLEVAPLSPDEIRQFCLQRPVEVETFFEIPFHADLEPYLEVLQQTGTAAKLRTGGMTQEAFPSPAQLGQRILALATAGIPFKATAGLHHPLCGPYRLSDESNSPTITMHGFLNVAIASAFAAQQRLTLSELTALLAASSLTSFQFTPEGISWADRSLTLPELDQARQRCFRSLGSCSFAEPIADLTHLNLL